MRRHDHDQDGQRKPVSKLKGKRVEPCRWPMLALAGLMRLNFRVAPEGRIEGDAVPNGLLATILETEVMLPCVGQGALGIAAEDRSVRHIGEARYGQRTGQQD